MTDLNNLYPAATTLPSGPAQGLAGPAATTLLSSSPQAITPPPAQTLPSGADLPLGDYSPLPPAAAPPPTPYRSWGEVALELATTRVTTLPDDAARLALTVADGVRVGTIVSVTATGVSYVVADTALLDQETGYILLGSAGPATILVRQGTQSELAVFVLASGELGYATDTKILYVGDGITAGGNPVTPPSTAVPHSFTQVIEATGNVVGIDTEIILADTFASAGIRGLMLGSNLKVINARAFQFNSSLNQPLTFPDTLQSIGESAFAGCDGIYGSLIFPDSLSGVGLRAFKGCGGISFARFGPNTAAVVGNAFQDCEELLTIHAYCGPGAFFSNSLVGSSVETIHVRSTDTRWIAGVGQTIGNRPGINIIKDL